MVGWAGRSETITQEGPRAQGSFSLSACSFNELSTVNWNSGMDTDFYVWERYWGDVAQLVKRLPSMLKALALISSITQNQVCWHMSIIIALGSWRPVWNTRDSISKTKLILRKEYMTLMKMLNHIHFGD